MVIRVMYTHIAGHDEAIQAYVSLRKDREGPGGGYRPIVSVLKNDKMRAALLAEACEDMLVFERKYAILQELKPIFEAMKRARRRKKK